MADMKPGQSDGPGDASDTPELAQPQSIDDQMTVSCTARPAEIVTEGTVVTLRADSSRSGVSYQWIVSGGTLDHPAREEVRWNTTGLSEGDYTATVTVRDSSGSSSSCVTHMTVQPRPFARGDTIPVALRGVSGPVPVTLHRSTVAQTVDLPLWVVIRSATDALSFQNYQRYMDLLFCGGGDSAATARIQPLLAQMDQLARRRALPFNDTDAYRILKIATEAFLMVNCGVELRSYPFSNAELNDLQSRTGVSLDSAQMRQMWSSYLQTVNGQEDVTIPYLAIVQGKLRDVGIRRSILPSDENDIIDDCFGILGDKLTNPCFLELLWSYWIEQGMVVQTINAISRRFQNIHGPNDRDPLANLEIDPLRGLNNLLWGYIQDEQHRLTVLRRSYEYRHHYGLTLDGKAIPNVRLADDRSQFLEAFHNLLYLASVFFEQDDDTTRIADGFPLLNALKEVHLLLSQGAHNQFADLPATARQEMLIQQYILARPELREFLPTRIMVDYPEAWMDRVDAMKALQGWIDVPVLHFRNLAAFGEQILLTIRFGAWLDVNDPAQAANWARFWRAAIQSYIHAYRAVTGVDLTADTTDSRQTGERALQPSLHLRRRLAERDQPALPRRSNGQNGAGRRGALTDQGTSQGVPLQPARQIGAKKPQ
ncbi:MAG TPA: PKD domain-containing protein [Herpetosiphonaceae bacterium]